MKTTRQLIEERNELVCEAKALYAVKQTRDWTPEEDARFNELSAKDTGLIDAKSDEVKKAEELEAAFVRVSKETERKTAIERINDLATPSVSQPRVLPQDGNLPQDRTPEGKPYVKAAKLKAFKSDRAAYESGMWLRAVVGRMRGDSDKLAEQFCLRNGMEISNAASEGSGSGGGYLVPSQMAQTIIEVRETVGIARQVCSIQPMTSDTMTIPKRSGGLTVYYPNELATITDSDKSWAQINLVAEKRAVASKISQELVDDALISVVDNVVAEQGYALALQEDNELINGTGASSYGHVLGLKSAIGSAGVYTTGSNDNLWSEIDLGDVMGTMAKLPDRFNRNPVWICSSNFYWSVFARLLAAGGGNAIANLQSGPTGKTFLGIPVLTTSQMPTADADSTIHALFGQFDMGVILGDRMGIRIGRDDSTGFLADYVTLKATSRYDIKVHEPGDNSNAGSYVALKTNAA